MASSMVYRQRQFYSCNQVCLIMELFIRSSKPENAVEVEEAKKIAFILKRNQDDVTAKFVPIRAFPATLKSMKSMIESAEGTLKEVQKIEEDKKKNPDREAKKQAHRTARTKLVAIMKKNYTESLDSSEAFFGEEFSNITSSYFTKFGTIRKEKSAEAKTTASKSLDLQTKISCAEQMLKELDTNMLAHIKNMMQEAAEISDNYWNAKYDMDDAKIKLMKYHAEFAGSLDDAVLKDAIKLRTILEVIATAKMLGEDENEKLTKRGKEQTALHLLECNALEALLASGLLNEEEKTALASFDTNFKEDKTPFGFTYVENKAIVVKMRDTLRLVSAFSMLRQHLAHLKQEQNVINASTHLMAERIIEKQEHDEKDDEKDNATLTRELELAVETIVELRRQLKLEEETKNEAITRANNVESKLETAELELAKLESLRALAADIGKGEPRRQSRGSNDRRDEKSAPDENEWRMVNNGRGGNRANPRAQNRDNREGQKRGADDSSQFGLRDKNNQPYCQFQFTNADGCNKGQDCRYAKTHGMDDPHPQHESRTRKRPKKGAAPAAKDKDEKPRDARRDDRDRDNGNNEWGNDLYNVD